MDNQQKAECTKYCCLCKPLCPPVMVAGPRTEVDEPATASAKRPLAQTVQAGMFKSSCPGFPGCQQPPQGYDGYTYKRQRRKGQH